jgi:hypothetical protein
MIERMADMPPGTVGFRIGGDLTPEDYANVLTPGLQDGVQLGDGLRALYLVDDLDEIEPRALWSDAKLGGDMLVHHHDRWRRSAIVTDIEWMARASKLTTWMIPGEARVFPTSQLDAAKAWVAG